MVNNSKVTWGLEMGEKICVNVCVCVCVRERRERERENKNTKTKFTLISIHRNQKQSLGSVIFADLPLYLSSFHIRLSLSLSLSPSSYISFYLQFCLFDSAFYLVGVYLLFTFSDILTKNFLFYIKLFSNLSLLRFLSLSIFLFVGIAYYRYLTDIFYFFSLCTSFETLSHPISLSVVSHPHTGIML